MSYLNHSLGGVSSDGLSMSSTSGSLDGSGDGTLDIDIVLPDGRVKHLSVDARKPMLDLAVFVAGKCHLSPAGYTLQAFDPTTERPLVYKPSSSLHSLGVTTLHFVSKKSDKEKAKKTEPNIKPFEVTQRLTVNLPRNQKHILRVSPETTLADIFQMTCTNKNLDPYKHELVHPTRADVAVNMASPLKAYELNEITIVLSTASDPHLTSRTSHLPSTHLSSQLDTVPSTMPRSKRGSSKKAPPEPQSEGDQYMPGMQEKKKKGFFSLFSRKKGSKFTPESGPAANRMSMAVATREHPDTARQRSRPKSEFITTTSNEEFASSLSLSPSSGDASLPRKPPRTKRQAPAPPGSSRSSHTEADLDAHNGGQHLNHSRSSSFSSGGHIDVRSQTVTASPPSLRIQEVPQYTSSPSSTTESVPTTLQRKKRKAPAPPGVPPGVTPSPQPPPDAVTATTEIPVPETSDISTSTQPNGHIREHTDKGIPLTESNRDVEQSPRVSASSVGSLPEVGSHESDEQSPLVQSDYKEKDSEQSVVIVTSTKTESVEVVTTEKDLQSAVLAELQNVDDLSANRPIREDSPDGHTSNSSLPQPSTLLTEPRPPCQFIAPPPPESPPPPQSSTPIGLNGYGRGFGIGAADISEVEVAEHSTQVHVSFRNSLTSDPGSKGDVMSAVEQMEDLVEGVVDDEEDDYVDDEVIIPGEIMRTETSPGKPDLIQDDLMMESLVDDEVIIPGEIMHTETLPEKPDLIQDDLIQDDLKTESHVDDEGNPGKEESLQEPHADDDREVVQPVVLKKAKRITDDSSDYDSDSSSSASVSSSVIEKMVNTHSESESEDESVLPGSSVVVLTKHETSRDHAAVIMDEVQEPEAPSVAQTQVGTKKVIAASGITFDDDDSFSDGESEPVPSLYDKVRVESEERLAVVTEEVCCESVSPDPEPVSEVHTPPVDTIEDQMASHSAQQSDEDSEEEMRILETYEVETGVVDYNVIAEPRVETRVTDDDFVVPVIPLPKKKTEPVTEPVMSYKEEEKVEFSQPDIVKSHQVEEMESSSSQHLVSEDVPAPPGLSLPTSVRESDDEMEDFDVPVVPLPKRKENVVAYSVKVEETQQKDSLVADRKPPSKVAPSVSESQVKTENQALKKSHQRLSLVDIKASNPHTILALKAKGPPARASKSHSTAAEPQKTELIRPGKTGHAEEVSRRKSAPVMGQFSVSSSPRPSEKTRPASQPEVIIINKSTPLPVFNKKIQKTQPVSQPASKPVSQPAAKVQPITKSYKAGGTNTGLQEYVRIKKALAANADVSMETEIMFPEPTAAHISLQEDHHSDVLAEKAPPSPVETQQPALPSSLIPEKSTRNEYTYQSDLKITSSPIITDAPEPEEESKPAVTEDDRHRVSFWGPRPWNARTKSEPNMKDVRRALDIVRQFEAKAIESPSSSSKDDEVYSEVAKDRCYDLSFEPRGEMENGEEMEEKSISLRALPPVTTQAGEGQLSASPRRLGHYSSTGSLPTQSMSVATGIDVDASGEKETYPTGTQKVTLQKQYDDLQSKFSKWQDQLMKNQAIINRKLGTSSEVVKEPLGRTTSDNVTTRAPTSDSSETNTRSILKNTSSGYVGRREGSPPPSAIPAAPAPPPVQVTETKVTSRRAVRSLPPPALDPREELMIAIRNAGGRGVLNKMPQTDADW